MTAYLPGAGDLAGAGGLIGALALFYLLGAAISGRMVPPEIQLVAGWGCVCIVLTLWGVATPLSLRIPLGGCCIAAILCLAVPRLRRRAGRWTEFGRMAALCVPLWLVALPMRPSQIDTWLNLLPNAAYLFDHDMLPRADRPPSWSFLPVAPYDSQFTAYAASVASGQFAAGAMGLFNVVLLAAAALLLARVLHGAAGGTPPWWACAAGLLLAIPLNPGFVPRTFLAAYGEPSLAVTTLFAVWLSAGALADIAAERRIAAGPALALVLAALVNIKQSGIGLLLAIGGGLLLAVLAHGRIDRRKGLAAIAGIFAPSIVLYLVWRAYATTSFTAGELQPLPIGAWNFGLLPQILSSVVVAIFQKATFYACVLVVLVAAILCWRRDPHAPTTLRLGLTAIIVVLFTGFILTTYIVHFPPEMAVQAHSFFRYGTQLSLLVMLGLIEIMRPLGLRLIARWPVGAGHARRGVVAFALAFPLALVPLLRFDLDPPQPALWDLGHAVAREIDPGSRLALLVPGDQDDGVGSMLRGVLLFTEPRRPRIEIRTETRADPDTLATVAAAGFHQALVTCTPAGLDNVPPGVAALLHYRSGEWQVAQTWKWPEELAHRKFAALLARPPLCAGQ